MMNRFKSKQFLIIVVMLAITFLLGSMLLSDYAKNAPAKPEEIHPQELKSAPHDEANHAENHADNQVTLNAEQLKSIALKTDLIAPAQIAMPIDLAGEVKLDTDQQAHVSSPFAGKVESVLVKTGQRVHRGQALATLRNPELVTLQGNLSAAKARLSLAQTNYDRERALWQQGISAKQDLQQAENTLKLAQIEVNSLSQQNRAYGGNQRKNQHGQLVLAAPISGHITSKDITIGESIQTSTTLMTIANLDALIIEFAVPPTLAAQLMLGMPLTVKTAITNNQSSPPLQATLLSYAPNADAQTRNLIARAKIESTSSGLRPNMLVTVQLADKAQPVAMAVKTTAVQTIANKTVIFIQQPDDHSAENNTPHDEKIVFKAQEVVLGQVNPQGYSEVISGVALGAAYVSQGSFSLKSELEKGQASHDH